MPYINPKGPKPPTTGSGTGTGITSRVVRLLDGPSKTPVIKTPIVRAPKATPVARPPRVQLPKISYAELASLGNEGEGSFRGVTGYAAPSRVQARAGSKASTEKFFSLKASQGVNRVLSELNRVIGRLRAGSVHAAYDALLPVFKLSQEYVPYYTGALHDSGRIEIGPNKRNPYVTIHYGGGESGVNYAAIVHERVDLHHEAPTRSKYLQAAFEELQGELYMNFALALKEATGV